jgi:hypothetical protein
MFWLGVKFSSPANINSVNIYCMCLHSSVQNSLCLSILNMCTVKPVLIGHHWDKEKVVS